MDLDLNADDILRLAESLPEVTPEPQTPSSVVSKFYIGQKFLITTAISGPRPYILCKIDKNKVGLINIDSGGRWSDPISVGDIHSIDPSELDRWWETLINGAYWKLLPDDAFVLNPKYANKF